MKGSKPELRCGVGVQDSFTVIEIDRGELTARSTELHRLQLEAYSVEARLIGDDRIPALHESQDEMVALPIRWLMALTGEQLVGALGFTTQTIVEIDRLIVDPQYQRRGIGLRLVKAVLQYGDLAEVSTGRDNEPARRLYERLGFTHIGDQEVLPDLWVSRYAKGL